jgi:hypothetical protein
MMLLNRERADEFMDRFDLDGLSRTPIASPGADWSGSTPCPAR